MGNTPQSRRSSADAAEILRIDVREPAGPVGGVLLYYAILAYPERNDWQKRRAFVDSMVAMRFREFIVQGAARHKDIPPGFKFKREKMLCGIRLGWKRVERRIHAGVMGWCIYLNEEHHLYAAPTTDGKVGIVLHGPNTVNKVIRAFIASRQVSSEPVHVALEPAIANVAHRVWAESFPVLHVAMENPITIKIVEALVRKDPITAKQIAKDFFDSIHQPSWLRSAIEDAENLKLILAEQLGVDLDDPRGLGYRPERAISLLPTEDPVLAYRL